MAVAMMAELERLFDNVRSIWSDASRVLERKLTPPTGKVGRHALRVRAVLGRYHQHAQQSDDGYADARVMMSHHFRVMTAAPTLG